jgi:hypothetical protein
VNDARLDRVAVYLEVFQPDHVFGEVAQFRWQVIRQSVDDEDADKPPATWGAVSGCMWE